MQSISVQALLDQLKKAGQVVDCEAIESFLQRPSTEETRPLFMNVVISIGAFFTMLGMIALMWSFNLYTLRPWSTVAVGVVFVAVGWVIHKYTLVSFTSMLTGKVLFYFGVTLLWENPWSLILWAVGIALATYFIYPIAIDRYVSSLAVLVIIQNNMVDAIENTWTVEILTVVFFVLLLSAAAFFLTSSKANSREIPMAYAILTWIGWFLLHSDFPPPLAVLPISSAYQALLNGLLTLTLMGLIAWCAGGWGKLNSAVLRIACGGTLVLGLISAPGLLLAIGMLVLGYAKQDRILTVGGALSFPIYLFYFYYDLDLNLLHKSFILIGSGLLLLAIRFYLRRRHLI